MQLRFGLSNAVPEDVRTAWGARWIWPDDMLPDRQGFETDLDDAGADAFFTWLNSGPLMKARAEARRLASSHQLSTTENRQVTLYEDDGGIVVGNPNGSHGYLYVSAWKHAPVTASLP